MTQKEFIRFYKTKMGANKTYEQAEKDVKGFLKAIEDAMIEDAEAKIVFPGFGVFAKKMRVAKTIKHPKTGKELFVPAQEAFTFKASDAIVAKIRAAKNTCDN